MSKPRTLATVTQFRREVEARIKAQGGKVEWTEAPTRVRYPTGLLGYRGTFQVAGVSYLATYDKHTDGPHVLHVKPLVRR